jgi:hypothetical protein
VVSSTSAIVVLAVRTIDRTDQLWKLYYHGYIRYFLTSFIACNLSSGSAVLASTAQAICHGLKV